MTSVIPSKICLDLLTHLCLSLPFLPIVKRIACQMGSRQIKVAWKADHTWTKPITVRCIQRVLNTSKIRRAFNNDPSRARQYCLSLRIHSISALRLYYETENVLYTQSRVKWREHATNCKNVHPKPGFAIISATVGEITKISLSLCCFRCETRQMLCGIPPRYLLAPKSPCLLTPDKAGQTFTVPNALCPGPANSVPSGTAQPGEKRCLTTHRLPSAHGTGARLRWPAAHGG